MPPSTTQRNWFIGLWLFWAILLFGGFIFGPADPDSRMPLWTRISSSTVLVLTAWSWYALYRRQAPVLALLALGMSCGLLGDLTLAGLMPGGRSVIGGLVAFGLGHIFYIMAALQLGRGMGKGTAVASATAWGFWLLLGLLGWYFMVFRGQEPSLLHWVALPYALLLASTAGLATGLAQVDRHFWLFTLGAALFFASDLILAGRLFSDLQFWLIGDVIWLTYGPGQMLIVYTATAILRPAPPPGIKS